MTVTCKRTDKSCDKKVFNKMSKLVKKYQSDLTKKEIDYLINFTCQTSNLYGLPKAHKSDITAKAIEEQNSEYIKIHEPGDLTLRRIVADPNCPTKRSSTFIDTIIKPLVLHIKKLYEGQHTFLAKMFKNGKWKDSAVYLRCEKFIHEHTPWIWVRSNALLS